MMRQCARLLLAVLALALVTSAALAGSDAEEQRRVVTRFLEAYVRQDMPAVRTVIADGAEARFGPYPFTGPYKLTQPKVDDHQALVEFTAPVRDSKYPARGGLLLHWAANEWHVRQILFYDQVPRLLNLPSRSVTNSDRHQEPIVMSVAQTFLAAWSTKDLKTMEAHTYDWASVSRDPTRGLSMSNLTFTTSTTVWGDPFIKYTARLTYRFSFLSYSMNFQGGLVLTQDNGAWKVRANQLLFDF
jgi:hypothetical protein